MMLNICPHIFIII